MAVTRVAPINIQGVALTTHPIRYICDTTAELPTSGLKLGDEAVAKDSNWLYKAASATTWTSVGVLGSTPSTQAFGDAAAGGSATDGAKTDHKHAWPSFATPTIALGTAGAAGAATTPVRSDSTIAAFDATGPTTVAFGNAAAAGVVAFAARRDHGHGLAALVFTKGAAFFDATAVPVATVAVWTAPFACTVTAIKGYRVGGTGATINAYKGTTATKLRSADLSVTSASTWMDGGAVQNTAFAASDSLLIGVVSATGSPTQLSVQVNFTRP